MDTGLWRVARRPRWIAALILALTIAGSFAWLAQWQLERSAQSPDAAEVDTEQPVELTQLTQPQSPVTDDDAGRIVTVSGTLRADGAVVRTGRFGAGPDGEQQSAWLIGRVDTADGATLVAALGWAEDADAALAAAPTADQEVELTGRYLPGEGPQESDFEAGERTAVSPAELVNEWDGVEAIYGGYLIFHDDWPGLGRIHSPEPEPPAGINWLNLFYAVEWVLFALFGLYIWYRLVADAYELEQAEAVASSEAGDGPPRDTAPVD